MVAAPTSQHDEEGEQLPEQPRGVYDKLVEEHKFHCTKHYGRALLSYKVLADLVRGGWHPASDAP